MFSRVGMTKASRPSVVGFRICSGMLVAERIVQVKGANRNGRLRGATSSTSLHVRQCRQFGGSDAFGRRLRSVWVATRMKVLWIEHKFGSSDGTQTSSQGLVEFAFEDLMPLERMAVALLAR